MFPKSKSAIVFGLNGDLGSGKTTFVQGLAKGLGIKSTIPSPTFIIVRRYIINTVSFNSFYHIDLYRLEDKKGEFDNLGLNEIFADSHNFIVIEWVHRFKQYLPSSIYFFDFIITGENKRKIETTWRIVK